MSLICTPASYFTQATIDHLGTIDDIAHVRDVAVTDGMFKSTRVGKSRTKTDEHNRSDTSRVTNSITRTYAAFPSPYQRQGQPGTPSSNPVLMHEPYQRRDQAEYYQEQVEPSAPYSQRSPSPTSPTTSGQHFGDTTSYSASSRGVPSTSYVDHRYPTSPIRASHSPYSPHYQPPSTHAMPPSATSTQNYSTPRTLSSPWVNQDSYYYARQSHSRPASSQSVPPMSYLHSNTTSHTVGPSSHITSPRSDHPNFMPSYSLELALTPPQPMPEYRGVPLAPLQIPPQHYTGARQCQTPPDSAIVIEDPSEEGGLAPLNELKRQGRYRREPLDEKTLRLLIASQSTP